MAVFIAAPTSCNVKYGCLSEQSWRSRYFHQAADAEETAQFVRSSGVAAPSASAFEGHDHDTDMKRRQRRLSQSAPQGQGRDAPHKQAGETTMTQICTCAEAAKVIGP